ncbi:MAG: hypothetical protein ACKO2C_05875 [Actinomycetes bacterium]
MRPTRRSLELATGSALRSAAAVVAGITGRLPGSSARAGLPPEPEFPLPDAPGRVIAATAHWSVPERFDFFARAIAAVQDQVPSFGFAAFVNGPRSTAVVAADLRASGHFPDDVAIDVVAERDAAAYLMRAGSRIACIPWHGRGNPYRLTWRHHRLYRDLVLRHDVFRDVTHLVYFEDDMALAPDALAYWCAYRPLLAPHGLLPGFLRVEGPLDDLRMHGWRRRSDGRPRVAVPEADAADPRTVWFVNLSGPYQAMYVLDRDLAEWHVRHSPFRSRGRSKVAPVHGARWGVPERAATGPIFDRAVPDGFLSRNCLPLVRTDGDRAMPLPASLVRHLPDKDLQDLDAPQGKTRLVDAFILDPDPTPTV